jgi:hypothetical protein
MYGIKTLELHVFPNGNNNDNKYISFAKLVDIHGNTNDGVGNGANNNNLGTIITEENSNSNSAQLQLSYCGPGST